MTKVEILSKISRKNTKLFKECQHYLPKEAAFIVVTMECHAEFPTIFIVVYNNSSRIIDRKHIEGYYSHGVLGPSKNPKLKAIIYNPTLEFVVLTPQELETIEHIDNINRLCND